MLLGAVFAIAAAGKLIDLDGSRRSLEAFGVRGDAARIAGTALPLAEAATALLLLLKPTAQVGAGLALVLLGAFIAGITNAVRQGQTPDCNCFGALHSSPAGRNTIGRNAALAALAIVVLVEGPGPAIDTWVAGRSGAVIVAICLSLFAIVLVPFVIRYWRSNKNLTEEVREAHRVIAAIPPGLPIGSLAPEFDVSAADGGRLSLASLAAAGRPIVLVFAFPGCGVCSEFLPDLEHWEPALAERITIGFVGWETFKRSIEFVAVRVDNEPFPEDLDAETHALLQVLRDYKLVGTPSAVMVTPDGYIASSTVEGRPAVEALLRVALTRAPAASANGAGRAPVTLAAGS